MMTPEEKAFHQLIAQTVREIRGEDSQKDIAELLNVGATFISEIELVKRKMPLEKFFRLIKAKGLTITTDGDTIQLYKKMAGE